MFIYESVFEIVVYILSAILFLPLFQVNVCGAIWIFQTLIDVLIPATMEEMPER